MSGSGVCVYCGREVGAVERDHLSGRDERGRYFDADLWVGSCRGCNVERYQVWMQSGLDVVAVHPMATRLARVAVACDKLADAGRDVVVAPAQLAAVAGLLREAACVIVGLVGALILLVIFQRLGAR